MEASGCPSGASSFETPHPPWTGQQVPSEQSVDSLCAETQQRWTESPRGSGSGVQHWTNPCSDGGGARMARRPVWLIWDAITAASLANMPQSAREDPGPSPLLVYRCAAWITPKALLFSKPGSPGHSCHPSSPPVPPSLLEAQGHRTGRGTASCPGNPQLLMNQLMAATTEGLWPSCLTPGHT